MDTVHTDRAMRKMVRMVVGVVNAGGLSPNPSAYAAILGSDLIDTFYGAS